MNPFPPTIQEPVFDIANQITVNNVIAGATITILKNGRLLAERSAYAAKAHIKISESLTTGDIITATQTIEGVTSGISKLARTVLSARDTQGQLPPLVFLSDVNLYMDYVWLGGCIPGATIKIFCNYLTVTDPPLLVASGIAHATDQAFQLKDEITLHNTYLTAVQEYVPVNGSTLPAAISPIVRSLDVYMQQLPEGLLEFAPLITNSPSYCNPLINITNSLFSVHTDYLVNNEIVTSLYSAGDTSSISFAALNIKLEMGDVITARHRLKRLKREGKVSGPISVTQQTLVPLSIQSGICDTSKSFVIANLVPGGRLKISLQRMAIGSIDRVEETYELGETMVSETTAEISFPENWLPPFDHSQRPKLKFAVEEDLTCGVSLTKKADVAYDMVNVPIAIKPITILSQPLYTCARIIVLDNVNDLCVTEVFSNGNATPLVARYPSYNHPELLPLPRGLQLGEVIKVVKKDCRGEIIASSEAITVIAFNVTEAPHLPETIYVNDKGIWADKLWTGGRVHFTIKRATGSTLPPFSFNITSGREFFELPLQFNDTITAQQTLCTVISSESLVKKVSASIMSISLQPQEVTLEETFTLYVTAKDANSGALVVGRVLVDGIDKGTTQSNIKNLSAGNTLRDISIMVQVDGYQNGVAKVSVQKPKAALTLLSYDFFAEKYYFNFYTPAAGGLRNYYNPLALPPGTSFFCEVTVQNKGKATANNVRVDLRFAPSLSTSIIELGSKNLGRLTSNQSALATFEIWIAAAGTIFVDLWNLDENQIDATFQVLVRPAS